MSLVNTMPKTGAGYYFLNNSLVDPDVAMKNREVMHENVITSPTGAKLFTITFKQVLQDFGVRNWNGRIYDQDTVMRGLNNNPLIQHDIKMKTWAGEYGHPLIEKGMNELQRQMTLFPPNCCWSIDKYWVEGNLLMGECTTLSGGYGDMVRDRVLTNFPAMASSRAIGGVDKDGKVLPGYTPITFDCVIRPSHKVAYKVPESERINEFKVPAGNSMSESAVSYDFKNDPSFKDFLLSESASKQQICTVCDAFNISYDSMQITNESVIFECVEGLERNTIVIPLRNMINAEYYNLF